MNKELLISIKPEHLVNILNGKKTLELRKTVPKDYKGWVNIYCSMVGKGLFKENKDTYFLFSNGKSTISLNGKVVARFWFDEYEDIKERWSGDEWVIMKLDELCLTDDEVREYLINKRGYAWHIEELEIFDKPKELSDFYRHLKYPNGEIITPNICEYSPFDYDDDLNTCLKSFELKKAPQSYQFVYVKE